ncbi:gag protein, partial [Oceanospirillum multiglobuliferum]|uniref:gag protein n=1 Tax=Oceanospirillum multiglobuliferum TaxID=64969 RepID=UPI001118D733
MQALEETLSKHDKGTNKQKVKTIEVVTYPNGSHTMAYPVIVHEKPADDTHPEPYMTYTLQPMSIKDYKKIKEAVVTYGIQSTYVKQMLNSWSTSHRIIPDDWHQVISAVLEYSQQLQWKSWLREEAKNLEQQGKIRG